MINNEEKHSTRKDRCKEFRKLGLSDKQIEEIEKVISDYYLDYGVKGSETRINIKNKLMNEAGKYISEAIKFLNKLKDLYPDQYDRVVGTVEVQTLGVLYDKEKNRHPQINSAEPLTYLDFVKCSLAHHSTTRGIRGGRCYSKTAVLYSLSSDKKKRRDVDKKSTSIHCRALHNLTEFWRRSLKEIIKSDESDFMKFLSVIFYGDSGHADLMRKYYKNNYNIENNEYPIKANGG
ncbi:hypothetical protein [Edaphovirga cremea]|uniref:hypothetical protein n=1 Tax=Edaphovirga cremea TaxID=2267246 RepID=UPI0039894AEE